jgi:N-methylhydantoinase B/oxoprolinase/acetone carboxylase alpha subunit
VLGGGATNLASCVLNAGTEREENLPILMTRPLKAGDTLSITLPGGCGYGPACERSPERVANDVRDRLVSIEVACNSYRVVIDQPGMTLNQAATKALRAKAV